MIGYVTTQDVQDWLPYVFVSEVVVSLLISWLMFRVDKTRPENNLSLIYWGVGIAFFKVLFSLFFYFSPNGWYFAENKKTFIYIFESIIHFPFTYYVLVFVYPLIFWVSKVLRKNKK